MLAQFRDFLFRYLLIGTGIVVSALSLIVFLQPLDIAPAGVAGVADVVE